MGNIVSGKGLTMEHKAVDPKEAETAFVIRDMVLKIIKTEGRVKEFRPEEKILYWSEYDERGDGVRVFFRTPYENGPISKARFPYEITIWNNHQDVFNMQWNDNNKEASINKFNKGQWEDIILLWEDYDSS